MKPKTTQDTIVVFGATSAIGQEVCRIHAATATEFILCARDAEKLDIVAADLRSRGRAVVTTVLADFSDRSNYHELFDSIVKNQAGIDVWYFFHGDLPDQKLCEKSLDSSRLSLQTNLLSVLDLLHPAINYMEMQKSGSIVVVSSVAGDRGRGSNYIYGTAKGAISIYLQGARNRLAKSEVNVLDVKPGFVKTPMTAHLDRGGFLWAEPNTIANEIVNAVRKKRDVIYTPSIWRLIMFIIRAIPEAIFKRLNL